MFIKKNKIIFILFALITVINGYIFFNRDDYAFIKQSSFAELYPATANRPVKDLRKVNDSSIRIVLGDLTGKSFNWKVYMDGRLLTAFRANEPSFSLKEGIHNYRVVDNTADIITLTAEYISEKSSREKDRIGNAGITVFSANLPTLLLQKYLDTWKDDEIPVTKEEAGELHKIMKDSIRITGKESTISKIKKIGGYLGNKLCNAGGNPTSSINSLSVFEQYKASFTGQKLWCGNYAQIFNLFTRAAGIKSRAIHISRNFGSLKGNVHIFNEYYIPELRQWAAVDLLFDNIMYADAAGKILNAVEVKNTNPGDESVTVFRAAPGDSLITKPFSKLGNSFFNTYGRDKDLLFYHRIYKSGIYSLKGKIARYLTKQNWYEMYSDTVVITNFRFYIKQFFLLLELFFFFLIIVVFALNHAKKTEYAG